MEFGISMGCLSDPIKEQVEKQGFSITDKKAEELQSFMESINLLYMNDLMNEKEHKSIQKKLFTKIKKSVKYK